MKNTNNHRKDVLYFKLGGIWDSLRIVEKVKGKFILNKERLVKLENEYGLYDIENYPAKELKFTRHIHSYMNEIFKEQEDIPSQVIRIPGRNSPVNVKFIRLFDGESAHFTPPFISCFVSFILEQAWSNPDKIILGDHGTDTADIAFLPLLDVFTFDSTLPPIIFTGSNRTSADFERNTKDDTFNDLIHLTDLNLSSGAYWVFVRYLFSASDFVKVYPLTSRVIDDFSTFYAPHLTAQKLDDIFNEKKLQGRERVTDMNKKHISRKVTYENLYKALKKVIILDLGTQREISEYVRDMLNPKYEAIVIAAHSLGNVPNVIKHFAAEAARKNKLVILVSRCLIGEIKNVGSTYLLNVPELRSSGKCIISGYKLNKNVAKAIAVRALMEKLTQNQTQDLIDKFTLSRGLSEHDVIFI